MHTLDCIGGGVAYVYQCWGSRWRSRYRGTAHSSAMGEERVGVIDCGPSLGDYLIPDTGKYVPCTSYIFRLHGINARNMCM